MTFFIGNLQNDSNFRIAFFCAGQKGKSLGERKLWQGRNKFASHAQKLGNPVGMGTENDAFRGLIAISVAGFQQKPVSWRGISPGTHRKSSGFMPGFRGLG